MHRIKPLLISLLAGMICWSCNNGHESKGLAYYVSSEGNDQNSGLSESQAWLTVDRVNEQSFSAGDAIYFRSGDEFTGKLLLGSDDACTQEKRLLISSYGKRRARINGGDGAAVYADSCHFFTLENLEISGNGRKSGNTSDGILVMNSTGVLLNNLDVYGFQHSGIHVHKCKDASVTHVHAHENGFAGIHVSGSSIWEEDVYDNSKL